MSIKSPLASLLLVCQLAFCCGADRSKIVLESGMKRLATSGETSAAVSKPPADIGKRRIESSARRVLEAPASNHGARGTAAADSQNPKVAPGKVLWRRDFQSACAASQKSGKPVLLFQMMGNLDDRFC